MSKHYNDLLMLYREALAMYDMVYPVGPKEKREFRRFLEGEMFTMRKEGFTPEEQFKISIITIMRKVASDVREVREGWHEYDKKHCFTFSKWVV